MLGYDALRNAYHQPLAIPPVRNLGSIHWMLIDASNKIRKKTHADAAEVGTDEIYWWVFTKETDLQDLRDKTVMALGAADSLKKAADSLGQASPKTYGDLIALLLECTAKHDAEIQAVLDYVKYLNAKHGLLPAMLYSYRVWGSTPQGDRWANLKADALTKETDDALQELSEVVLGLSSGHRLHAVTKAEFEIGADKYDASEGKSVAMTEEEVLRRTSFLVVDECREYFTKIRDSLRNIILEIEKCKRIKNVLDDEAFWRRFVIAVTSAAGKTETELWDFKEVLPLWMIPKGPARDAERVSFSEGIAAFANHKGGVLIVGVSDAKTIVGVDVALSEDRLKFTRTVIDDHVKYSRNLVTFKQITVPDGSTDKVCLVIAVAQAAEIVGVKDNDKYSYPVRQETGLTRKDRIDLVLERGGRVASDNYSFLTTLQQFITDNTK